MAELVQQQPDAALETAWVPLHGPRIGSEFVALKRILLRLGVEKTSDPTEILAPGERITVLQTGQNVEGQVRVRCASGWVSLQAESGQALLQDAQTWAVAHASPNAIIAGTVTLDTGVESPSAAAAADAAQQWVVVPDPNVPTVTAPEVLALEEPQKVAQNTCTEAWVAAGADAASGLSGPPTTTAAAEAAGENSPRAEAEAAKATAAAVEVRRLQQQLAIAHMELEKLKAASSGPGVGPRDLARAAVELTARASGQIDSSCVPSLAVLGLLDVTPRPAIPQGAFAGGMSPFARARQQQSGFGSGPPPLHLGRPPAAAPRPYLNLRKSPQRGDRSPRATTRSAGDRSPRAMSRTRTRDGSPEVMGDARMVSLLTWKPAPFQNRTTLSASNLLTTAPGPTLFTCCVCCLRLSPRAQSAVPQSHRRRLFSNKEAAVRRSAWFVRAHPAILTSQFTCVLSCNPVPRSFILLHALASVQVKVDRWIDEWCIRHGIADHGSVVKMGLEKALIEPQDWVSLSHKLSYNLI